MLQFDLQQQAFAHLDSLSPKQREGLKLFSIEMPQSGKRKFVLCHQEKYRDAFRSNDTDKNGKPNRKYFTDINSFSRENRHWYEIIRDGFPCRLYFDCEYTLEDGKNSDVDGDYLIHEWCTLVSNKIYALFGISLDKTNFPVLDASIPGKKFSRHIHVIVNTTPVSIPSLAVPTSSTRAPEMTKDKRKQNGKETQESVTGVEREYLFLNNMVVGHLVQSIISDITTASTTHEQTDGNQDNKEYAGIRPRSAYSHFWIQNKAGSRVPFVDLAVYTRNRMFRTFGSCKYGKSPPNYLRLTLEYIQSGYGGFEEIDKTLPGILVKHYANQRSNLVLKNTAVIPLDLLNNAPPCDPVYVTPPGDTNTSNEHTLEVYPYTFNPTYGCLDLPEGAYGVGLVADTLPQNIRIYDTYNSSMKEGDNEKNGAYKNIIRSQIGKEWNAAVLTIDGHQHIKGACIDDACNVFLYGTPRHDAAEGDNNEKCHNKKRRRHHCSIDYREGNALLKMSYNGGQHMLNPASSQANMNNQNGHNNVANNNNNSAWKTSRELQSGQRNVSSPFPKIDVYISHYIRGTADRGGCVRNSYIHSWSLYGLPCQSDTRPIIRLRYHITGYR